MSLERLKRNEPILHELILRHDTTQLERRFVIEPNNEQPQLSVRLGDGVYWVTGVNHVRIVNGRIVDAD